MPARDDAVDTVEGASRDTREHAAYGSCEPHRLEELHATGAVANEGSVRLREVPCCEPLVLIQTVEERCCLEIVER